MIKPTNVLSLEASMKLCEMGIIAAVDSGKAASAIFEICFPVDFKQMQRELRGAAHKETSEKG